MRSSNLGKVTTSKIHAAFLDYGYFKLVFVKVPNCEVQIVKVQVNATSVI